MEFLFLYSVTHSADLYSLSILANFSKNIFYFISYFIFIYFLNRLTQMFTYSDSKMEVYLQNMAFRGIVQVLMSDNSRSRLRIKTTGSEIYVVQYYLLYINACFNDI